MLITLKSLDEAVQELKQKSYEQIERETAVKWASRYLASKKLGKVNETYRHEAIEHGSLAGIEFLIKLVDEIGEA